MAAVVKNHNQRRAVLITVTPLLQVDLSAIQGQALSRDKEVDRMSSQGERGAAGTMESLPSDSDETIELPHAVKDSLLFTLSAELRNIIYRFALVEDNNEYIVVYPQSFTEPGLIKTCKPIRDEARAIYFAENRFLLRIESFDCTSIVKWCAKVKLRSRKRKLSPHTDILLDQDRHFRNLSIWLQNIRRGTPHCIGLVVPAVRPPVQDNHCMEQHILVNLFQLAYDADPTDPARMRRCIEAARPLLGHLHSGWLQDH